MLVPLHPGIDGTAFENLSTGIKIISKESYLINHLSELVEDIGQL